LFDNSTLLSSRQELEDIADLVRISFRLPLDGGFDLEDIVAHVRGGKTTKSRDFVDVVLTVTGFQIKSALDATPITWKRIRIRHGIRLIQESRCDASICQQIGDSVIAASNTHMADSFEKYGLDEIGYGRLILDSYGTAVYFERLLCTRKSTLFAPADFRWELAKRALHGVHRETGETWFRWNGDDSDNQLHFVGERRWWPSDDDPHCIRFGLPAAMSLEEFLERIPVKSGGNCQPACHTIP